jgi:DNA-binding transcriptional LysR family regulator
MASTTTKARPPALPTLDIGLVRALVALVTEQSVSRAAAVLGQSQPQLSATLRRMRVLLHDPILVRGSRGMVPTEQALLLLDPARRILDDMNTLLAERQAVEPEAVRRLIQIAVPDFVGAPLMAAIVGRIRREAPESTILVRPVRGDAEGIELLESGQADVLIESSLVSSTTIHCSTLFDDAVLSVAAKSNPHVFDGMSIDDYLRLPHVAAAPASGLKPGLIDAMLARQGLSRRVVAWVPYLNTLPLILAGSDLVFTTTAHLASHFARQAELRLFEPPVRLPSVRYLLMWHERLHRSGEHRWLRKLIQEAVAAALP